MAAPIDPTFPSMSASGLRDLLVRERDPHVRQRALVRASLVARPGRARPALAPAH